MEKKLEMYIGDGVYAESDGYEVILYTSDGVNRKNEIFLDELCVSTLKIFFKRLEILQKEAG